MDGLDDLAKNQLHSQESAQSKTGKVRKRLSMESFRAFYCQSDEPLAVDREWAWPEDGEKLSKATKELGWYSYWKRRSDKKRESWERGQRAMRVSCSLEIESARPLP